MPDSQTAEYFAKAKWADEKAEGAASAELAEQWRNVANTYRQAANILERAKNGGLTAQTLR